MFNNANNECKSTHTTSQNTYPEIGRTPSRKHSAAQAPHGRLARATAASRMHAEWIAGSHGRCRSSSHTSSGRLVRLRIQSTFPCLVYRAQDLLYFNEWSGTVLNKGKGTAIKNSWGKKTSAKCVNFSNRLGVWLCEYGGVWRNHLLIIE